MPVSGPHRLRNLTVTAVMDAQGQPGAPCPAAVAVLMGNTLQMWNQVYDLARQQRSLAAQSELGALEFRAWRNQMLQRLNLPQQQQAGSP